MAPFENPIVLVTRPADSAARFVAALRDVAGAFEPLVLPAFEVEALAYEAVPFEDAVFTSRAGAMFAPDGAGRVAWCVGEATADAARAKGYVPKVGCGGADALVTLILEGKPRGRLVHFRGEKIRVFVTDRLNAENLNCLEIVNYHKRLNRPTAQQLAVLQEGRPCVAPVFSGETVSIIGDWDIPFDQVTMVAISPEVAEVAKGLQPFAVTCAQEPDLGAMVRATSRLIA